MTSMWVWYMSVCVLFTWLCISMCAGPVLSLSTKFIWDRYSHWHQSQCRNQQLSVILQSLSLMALGLQVCTQPHTVFNVKTGIQTVSHMYAASTLPHWPISLALKFFILTVLNMYLLNTNHRSRVWIASTPRSFCILENSQFKKKKTTNKYTVRWMCSSFELKQWKERREMKIGWGFGESFPQNRKERGKLQPKEDNSRREIKD